MKSFWQTTTILLLGSTLSGTVLAAGFALNEQSASGLGQAFAGRASDAIDASTVFGNPAGMARLNTQFTGGIAIVSADTEIDDAIGTVGPATVSGSNDGDMVPTVVIPYGYYVHKINDQVSAGFGLYSPFGLVTDYESNFQGRYFATKSELKMVTAQPTVSFRFNEHLALGLGVTYNSVEGELSRAAPNPLGGADIQSKVEGDDASWGYNVGVLVELNAKTRAGITYHSEVDYTLEGDTKISGHPLLGNPKYDASLDITLPDLLDISLTHELVPGLNIHANAARTGWKEFDELRIENEGAPGALATVVEPEDWHNTWSYGVGLSYQINQQFLVRGGIALDQSPIPNSHRTVRIPSDDRTIFAVGMTWTPTQQLSADLGYAYLHESATEVNQTSGPLHYEAEYDNGAHVLAAQINWKL
jgi:long-chain fatty acid transport protein